MGFSWCPVIGTAAPSDDGGSGDEPDDWGSSLESLLMMEPGPAAMVMLCSIDASRLDADDRLTVIEAWRRQEAWVAAASQASIVAAAKPCGPSREDAQWQQEIVARALRLPVGTATDRVETARVLTEKLPATLMALEFGDISYWHAHVLAETCADLDDVSATAIEARVLPNARDQTAAAFRRSVRRAFAREAPDMVAAAHDAAASQRDVRFYADPDGMATVSASMPATDAHTVFLAIDVLAHLARDQARDAETPGGPVDERGIGAWRADVLVGWAREVLADPSLPKVHGRPVKVHLVIDEATALGRAERPAELIGYGAIPASVARELLADADWQRFIVDPIDGHLLDVGRAVYRPSQKLMDFIVARDRHCRFPGCTRPATHCDVDHAIPHGAGGETTRKNCGCLCRRHHIMKTLGYLQLESFDDGSCRWVFPGGRRIHVPAQRYLDTG
jgi:hypothetical protein